MEKTHGQIEDCLNLDSRVMARYKVFDGGGSNSWAWRKGKSQEVFSSITYHYDNGGLELSYTCNEQQHRYLVDVVTTPCNYGGKRYWFNCPKCSKRVAKLYLRNSMFFCRTCHKLNYSTQQSCKLESTRVGMYKIRDKLNWQYDTAFMKSWHKLKPKGMHYSTYNRLVQRHDELERKSEQYCIANFHAFMNRHGLKPSWD